MGTYETPTNTGGSYSTARLLLRCNYIWWSWVYQDASPAVRLSSCPMVQLSDCPAVWLSSCPTVQLRPKASPKMKFSSRPGAPGHWRPSPSRERHENYTGNFTRQVSYHDKSFESENLPWNSKGGKLAGISPEGRLTSEHGSTLRWGAARWFARWSAPGSHEPVLVDLLMPLHF